MGVCIKIHLNIRKGNVVVAVRVLSISDVILRCLGNGFDFFFSISRENFENELPHSHTDGELRLGICDVSHFFSCSCKLSKTGTHDLLRQTRRTAFHPLPAPLPGGIDLTGDLWHFR